MSSPGLNDDAVAVLYLQEGMVNVKHRRCAESGCNTRPAFNWNGEEKGAYCNKHKEKGMINVDKKEPRAGGPLSSLPHAALLSTCLG